MCCELTGSPLQRSRFDETEDDEATETAAECAGEGLAAMLILASAMAASLQAIDAKYLAVKKLHWTVISLAMNATSAALLLGASVVRNANRKIEFNRWLAVRAVLGGISLNAAVAAVTHIDLASANTIMFSMPCFATAMTAVVERKLPSRSDAIRLVFGFVGTCLVVGHRRHLERSASDRILGYGGAFAFAVCNAAACVVTSLKLRGQDATVVCTAQALIALLTAGLCMATLPSSLLLSNLEVLDARLVILLALEVFSFPLSLFLRTAGLLLTRNVHIISLLYSEIPLVLVWDKLFCKATVSQPQIAGVVLIIGGAAAANLSRTISNAAEIFAYLETTTRLCRRRATPASYDALPSRGTCEAFL